MTDEEKAEKYLIRFLKKNNIVDILPIKTAWDLRCLLVDVIKYVFAEGRKMRWHDLRKDPSDLPTVDDGMYWTYNECGYYDIHIWIPQLWKECKVIAWCELPKFEE